MQNIDLLYASTDGHTRKICEQLALTLRQRSFKVSLWDLELSQPNPMHFERFIIAAPVRYGFHHPKAVKFIQKHHQILNAKNGALLSVNLVARKEEKRQAHTNPYVAKLLQKIDWEPKTVHVLAGKLDYPSYRFWDRWLIQMIMKMTAGPTHPSTVRDYTDWQDLERFGLEVFTEK